MASVTVLLQLWGRGWREETAPVVEHNLRIEALLGTGAIDTETEASTVALGQLDIYALGPDAETVAVEPVGQADTPWLSHRPGELVTLESRDEVVESLAMTRDPGTGLVRYVAELGTHVDTPEERQALTAKKMSNGTIGGTSRVAQPLDASEGTQRSANPSRGEPSGGCCYSIVQGTWTASTASVVPGFEGDSYSWSLPGQSTVGFGARDGVPPVVFTREAE